MQSQNNEDALYIKEFLEGSQTGFEALVRKYQDKVLNIVYSLAGRDVEIEDIVQEVFLKVYYKIGFFRGESRFSTWLYRVTVNTTYDFLRKRKARPAEDHFFEPASSSEGPRELLLGKEKEEAIKKALENVPFKFRAAVVLKDLEDLSYAEISEALHCSIGTVESRIYRGRQFLKKELFKLGVVQG